MFEVNENGAPVMRMYNRKGEPVDFRPYKRAAGTSEPKVFFAPFGGGAAIRDPASLNFQQVTQTAINSQ